MEYFPSLLLYFFSHRSASFIKTSSHDSPTRHNSRTPEFPYEETTAYKN